MPTNDFLPYATDPSAAVLDQASYAAASPQVGRGPGVVPKEYYNKSIRQGAVMASAVGLFINSQGGDALDNGNIPALELALLNAIKAAAGAVASIPKSVVVYNNSLTLFALTANLVLTEGTWLVDAMSSVWCSTFPEMYLSINGTVVQTQANFGDPDGAATSTLTGFLQVVVPPGGATIPIAFSQQAGGNGAPLFVRARADRIA